MKSREETLGDASPVETFREMLLQRRIPALAETGIVPGTAAPSRRSH